MQSVVSRSAKSSVMSKPLSAITTSPLMRWSRNPLQLLYVCLIHAHYSTLKIYNSSCGTDCNQKLCSVVALVVIVCLTLGTKRCCSFHKDFRTINDASGFWIISFKAIRKVFPYDFMMWSSCQLPKLLCHHIN